ncbi:MAG: dTDP-4-dehydrorhamnose reductase [Bacteroidota bacterium]|nr:dTDP-4-dehydrorhamnose reductase [Bacteroidota bacterium]
MIKILTTGAKGQLGKEVQKYSQNMQNYEFSFIDVDELDLKDPTSTQNYFSSNKFDYLINCAGYTAVDKAEEEEDAAFLINADALSHIIDNIRAHGTRLIHISTDYVFDGKGKAPYPEDFPTHPESAYGRSKLAGEEICLNYKQGMVIRTSWLYSSHGHNFVKSILKKGREQDVLKVVDDQFGTPTYAGHLAQALISIIDTVEQEEKPFIPGIFHYTNEGSCTWFEFATKIKSIIDLPCSIIPVKSTEYILPAKRPAYSILSKEKIITHYNLNIPQWEEGLKICLDELEETANLISDQI